jgi:hypothetical protein
MQYLLHEILTLGTPSARFLFEAAGKLLFNGKNEMQLEILFFPVLNIQMFMKELIAL